MPVGVAVLEVLVHRAEVRTDAEGLASTGQHDHVDVIVIGDAQEEVAQLGVHRDVERVEPLGSIELDPQDVLLVERRRQRRESVPIGHPLAPNFAGFDAVTLISPLYRRGVQAWNSQATWRW